MIVRRIRRDERGSTLVIALAFLALFSVWISATLTATESGLNIQQTMRVQPKRLYAADSAIERTIQKLRYHQDKGTWNDTNCNNGDGGAAFTLGSPPQTVFVRCEPAGDSGLADAGESSPPIGIIALSDGAGGEHAYQQFGNSVVRIDGGVFSNTPPLFSNGNNCNEQPNCQQLNLCPRNEKFIHDGVLIKNSVTVTSLSGPFSAEDVGVPIVGNGIPTGTTIQSFVSQTSIRMSKAATSGGLNRVIRFRENYPQLQSRCHIPTDVEDPPPYAIRNKGKFTAVPRSPLAVSCTNYDVSRIVSLKFNCNKEGQTPAYAPDNDGVDKNYPVDKSTGFAHRNVPSCDSGAQVVELLPGRYNDAVALSNLTTTCDKLIWFTPGYYYFDFPDGNAVWTIGASNKPNLVVVGGAKTWDREPFTASVEYKSQTNVSTVSVCSTCPPPFKASDANSAYINAGYNLPYKTLLKTVSNDRRSATFTGPPLTNNFSGTYTVSPIVGTKNPLGSLCDPATNVDHDGVEFIFGGESRMVLTDGKTEICSPVRVSPPSRQQIAIYGMKSGTSVLKAQSGCILAQPYTSGSNSTCPLIYAPAGSKPAFLVHGTIYAPAAAIDLTLQGVGYQVVSRGIIGRVVAFSISPSSQFTDPVIYSPNFDSVAGAPRKMTLTACIEGECPPDGSGRPKIRALVRIEDSDEFENPGVPGYKVFIDSWSVL